MNSYEWGILEWGAGSRKIHTCLVESEEGKKKDIKGDVECLVLLSSKTFYDFKLTIKYLWFMAPWNVSNKRALNSMKDFFFLKSTSAFNYLTFSWLPLYGGRGKWTLWLSLKFEICNLDLCLVIERKREYTK